MPHIDIDTFNSLKGTMGEDFIGELVTTYTTDTPILIAQLRSALIDKDSVVLHRAAHSIKSNAALFGATQLRELAEELESMGRQNNLNVGDRVEQLEIIYHQVESQLESFLKDL